MLSSFRLTLQQLKETRILLERLLIQIINCDCLTYIFLLIPNVISRSHKTSAGITSKKTQLFCHYHKSPLFVGWTCSSATYPISLADFCLLTQILCHSQNYIFQLDLEGSGKKYQCFHKCVNTFRKIIKGCSYLACTNKPMLPLLSSEKMF